MLHNQKRILLLAIVFAIAFAFSKDALAGSYQTIDSIPNGGAVALHITPRNQGAAAEATIVAWNSTTAVDTFRCGIISNSTGRALNLRMFGVNGTIIAQCTTAVNGGCATANVSLVANLEFQCGVWTQNGQPVLGANPHFVIEVRRP